MKRVCILLVVMALIAAMVSCALETDTDPVPPVQYTLSIFGSAGGSVTSPGEEALSYDAGTVVSLVATPASGYRFVEWTGEVLTVADASGASTSITMNGDYSIVANFVKCLEIWDWYGLHAVRYNLSGNYLLMNDLDSTTAGYQELASPAANDGRGWQPIGTIHAPFTGTLDGQGHEIDSLFINRPGESQIGLLSVLGTGGVIENLGVMRITVAGGPTVGGLAGVNRGLVSNSYSGGGVTGSSTVGGLVGVNRGTVGNSYSDGSVSGDWAVGGLVGHNSGAVTNSYSTGNVTANGDVGGLVGDNWSGSTVSNSYSNSNVTGHELVGGLVGRNYYDCAVSNSYSSGSVSGSSTVGGLVGLNNARCTVTYSYSIGNVTGDTGVGGLVGVNYGAVFGSFWDMETSGSGESDGGFGKTTAEMQDSTAFSQTWWDVIAVSPDETNESYTWNIVDGETYPFLSWQVAS